MVLPTSTSNDTFWHQRYFCCEASNRPLIIGTGVCGILRDPPEPPPSHCPDDKTSTYTSSRKYPVRDTIYHAPGAMVKTSLFHIMEGATNTIDQILIFPTPPTSWASISTLPVVEKRSFEVDSGGVLSSVTDVNNNKVSPSPPPPAGLRCSTSPPGGRTTSAASFMTQKATHLVIIRGFYRHSVKSSNGNLARLPQPAADNLS